MLSGVSGLRNHQTRMDVIGNNIANVNTVGYKASRVTFQEIFSQTLSNASAPANGRGGTNPAQVGLGVSLGSIDVLHMNGSAQRTDKATDLAIEGDGFFVVSDGTGKYYTRAGNFDVDQSGNLTAPGGLKLMGWLNDPATNQVTTAGEPKEINLANLVLPPKETSSITFEGNLDNRLAVGDKIPYTVSVFDAKGTEHKLVFTFTNNGNNQWGYAVNQDGVAGPVGSGTLTFDTKGNFNSAATTMSMNIPITGTENLVITPAFTADKFTQYSGEASVKASAIDGYKSGVLNGINIDGSGNVTGIYSNGQFRTEAVLALAQFTNPGGLEKIGDNLFTTSTNSGIPILGMAGQDGRGTINPGTLEMSNVDLAKEFTDMIATQRGFQANSRIITTSDEMLQELVNLKR
jgi:flagellar hook protein FlgE